MARDSFRDSRSPQQQGMAKNRSLQDGGKTDQKPPQAHYTITIMTPQVEGGLGR